MKKLNERLLQTQESVDDLISLLDQFRDEIINDSKGKKIEEILDYLQTAKDGLNTAYNEIQSIISLL